jgi:hypothetical protein
VGPHRHDLAVGAALGIAVLELVLGWAVGLRAKLLDVSAIIFFVALLIIGQQVGHDGRARLQCWCGEISILTLVLITVGSIAVREPFTIQYALKVTDEEAWSTPLFLHVDELLTWVWLVSFAVTGLVG